MVKASTEVAAAQTSQNPPTTAPNLSAFDGMSTGFENITAQDLLIPRLTIIQGLSPQVSQGTSEYDPEAKVGDIYDVGLQERFSNGVQFIPVHYKKKWIEWAPRESGKGLIHVYDDDSILGKTEKDERGKPILNGNYISETAELYGINVTADNRPCFIPMASTQLKKAKVFISKASFLRVPDENGVMVRPPLYYMVYKLTTVPEKNRYGNWMGWKITPEMPMQKLPNSEALKSDINLFLHSLMKGETKGDLSGIDGDQQRSHSEDIPF